MEVNAAVDAGIRSECGLGIGARMLSYIPRHTLSHGLEFFACRSVDLAQRLLGLVIAEPGCESTAWTFLEHSISAPNHKPVLRGRRHENERKCPDRRCRSSLLDAVLHHNDEVEL
jgi:hypothetical protein